MRITCPNCASEYNLPKPLAAGRLVRCAKCAQQWAPVPLVPESLPPPATQPLPSPDPEALPPMPAMVPMVPPPPEPVRRLPLLLAWVGSGVVVAAALAAAFVFRVPIMQKWPPSERVYSVLHLHPGPASPDVHGKVVE